MSRLQSYMSETCRAALKEIGNILTVADDKDTPRGIVAAVHSLQADRDKWQKEALRQYPTPEAYQAVCDASNKHRKRIRYLESIIRNYQLDVRNSKGLTGIDLVEVGFCQGEIYKTALEDE